MNFNLKKLYLSEIETDKAKHPFLKPSVFTEEDIARLPEPVQKYFRYCGYIGKEKIVNVHVVWGEVHFKRSPQSEWMSLTCDQYNSIAEPTRIVYMSSKLFGILPFEGRDTYQNGYGNMFIKILKIFTFNDEKGKEMDASALVTVLAELVLVPSYALQSYVQWTPLDALSAKATLTYNGTTVSGVFYFNEQGECTHFDTDDRYQADTTKNSTIYKKVKWSGVTGKYIEQDGIKIISEFRAVWHFDTGDLEYFKGKIKHIEFNVK
jgi:hypothetical protein